MRRRPAALLLVPAALVLTTLAASPCRADGRPAGGRREPPVVRVTDDYRDTDLPGDRVVEFSDDPLAGPAQADFAGMIRHRSGVVRVLLVRPRYNFVSELLKSIENL